MLLQPIHDLSATNQTGISGSFTHTFLRRPTKRRALASVPWPISLSPMIAVRWSSPMSLQDPEATASSRISSKCGGRASQSR